MPSGQSIEIQEHRIEYKLKTLDLGGEISYDGRTSEVDRTVTTASIS